VTNAPEEIKEIRNIPWVSLKEKKEVKKNSDPSGCESRKKAFWACSELK